MSAPADEPRVVTPGLETQWWTDKSKLEPGIFAGLDWLRCTGPDLLLDRLHSWCRARFGKHDRTTHGAAYFKRGWEWEPGIQISFGHAADVCMIDLRGERLRITPADDSIQILDELTAIGMKPTRIDLAIDWRWQDLGICEAARASCERKELCRLRSFEPRWKRLATGIPTKKLLQLGNRESAVCARIYDKGLEQGIPVPGIWERLEVEFKKDRAESVASTLLEAGADWLERFISLTFGGLDFREHNGRSELDRRPRARWWADLIGASQPIMVRPQEDAASFEQWRHAFQRSYGGRLKQIARALNVKPGVVAEQLLEGVDPTEDRHGLMREAIACLRSVFPIPS